jgi:uncharacterized protein YggE
MKIYLSIILLATTAFGLTINFSKSFDVEIKPDTLEANINITAKNKTEKEVVEALGKLSSFIDNDIDIEKKGGSYNVYPEYKYENNHRYKSGYVGNMQYNISSKDADKLNNFLTSLYGQKINNSEEISVNSVRWVMSKEQKNGKIDKLRLDAIIWANGYAKSLSNSLSQSCKVKSVSFSQTDHYYPQPLMRANYEAIADKSAPTPTQDKQKLSLTPTITLECR